MIVVRFKVQIQPDKVDEAVAAFRAVVEPSRGLDGVVSFDIARDITDPNTIIAVEVFEDRAALDRQEAQAEVANVMSLMPGVITGPPEATIFNVSSSEPHG
jgi:quinol monooxygenase YgiN